MLNFIKKHFDHSKRELKKMEPIVDAIEALRNDMEKLSDKELRNKTDEFKERLQKGETLDDILIEAFAVVREASKRTVGMFPFRVQLIGALVINRGNIAEMKTGEGKTLVAVMPAYLNALTGKGVHIVTVNEYLASFHAEWMGKIYNFLGLTVGVNFRELSPKEKQEVYSKDILYSTNGELGFDYLRDNRAVRKEDRVQKPLNYAIVDEVDSILIDEARTPLIISGGSMQSQNIYAQADMFVKTLKREKDYLYDEKTKGVSLTEEGAQKCEKAFNIDNLYDIKHTILVHHVNQALKANYSMKRDIDYVVKEGRVIIVDQFTGRLMEGRAYSEGLHQAVEAKEGVQIQQETRTLATITFQNYFRMYKKLAGMTGTAKTEEEEFRNIYNMYVVEIPTNKPVIRKDMADLVYSNRQGKFKAIVNEIEMRHKEGQPILVGTIAIETSELISNMLKKKKITHEVLNAKNHAREAEIIAQAGRLGAVTIATNMAGRGTDIVLGGNAEILVKKELKKKGYSDEIISTATSFVESSDNEVKEARKLYKKLYNEMKKKTDEEAQKIKDVGGLCVIGTERHEARRIDNQLRGRSGRQGDPGYSQFFVSLEDELMVRFGTSRIKGMLESLGFNDEQAIRSKMFTRSIESAQKRVEGNNFDLRKHLLQYDDVLGQQREIIYEKRNKILDNESIHETVIEILKNYVNNIIKDRISIEGNLDKEAVEEIVKITNESLLKNDISIKEITNKSNEQTIEFIQDKILTEYNDKLKDIPFEVANEFEKSMVLIVIDTHWMEHLNTMAHLREGIGLRGLAQENPLREYTMEGFQMFDEMLYKIEKDTSIYLLRSDIKKAPQRTQTVQGVANTDTSKSSKKTPIRVKKISRNDPCPCGSGKKYKQCCGK
ncbi:MAG: preprotein translocase subunit SecA [Bacilli bacterium]